MKRPRFVWVSLGIILLAGVALTYEHWWTPRTTNKSGFTDLDTAIAQEKAQGWELSVPPKYEGPYRRLPGEPVIAHGAKDGLVCRLRDANGTFEEIKLPGIEGYDQAVVYLETPSKQQTMAVLKRAR
jgi:hypothetical protein